jgi:hypothetical protein
MGKLIYHRYVLITHNDLHGNDEMLENKYSRTMPGGESTYLVMSERESRYHTISYATEVLGGITKTRELFFGFQEYLYAPAVA